MSIAKHYSLLTKNINHINKKIPVNNCCTPLTFIVEQRMVKWVELSSSICWIRSYRTIIFMGNMRWSGNLKEEAVN